MKRNLNHGDYFAFFANVAARDGLCERSIIFCPICAGIEAGQATEADYHVTPFDDGRDEPQDITATELLRQARLAKRQRLQEAT